MQEELNYYKTELGKYESKSHGEKHEVNVPHDFFGQVKIINESLEKLVRNAISDKEMYLLWAATHDLNSYEDGPKLFPTENDGITQKNQQLLFTKEKVMGVCENIENNSGLISRML